MTVKIKTEMKNAVAIVTIGKMMTEMITKMIVVNSAEDITVVGLETLIGNLR